MRELGIVAGYGGSPEACADTMTIRGIRIRGSRDGMDGKTRPAKSIESRLREKLLRLGLIGCVELKRSSDGIDCRLAADFAEALMPQHDTQQLAARLAAAGGDAPDDETALEREIVCAMLAAPHGFEYPNHDEFAAAIRIRRNIATAARKTALCFDTRSAERPEDCWTYHEDTGFTLIPGQALIPSLKKATQPELTGKCYSFSCYRATEYVILLGIAEALQDFNPELLAQLQRQWETRAIMSGRFHDVFLHEYGSMDAPLPMQYYIPGDRVWFRNPDPHSSDASGYEGSWVIYMGSGEFTNFWKRDEPYTLTDKCLELYHWRHAAYRDGSGELQIDERVVEACVGATRSDAEASARIVDLMLRYRDPQGVYADGGCIDTTRECPRHICPGTAGIMLQH